MFGSSSSSKSYSDESSIEQSGVHALNLDFGGNRSSHDVSIELLDAGAVAGGLGLGHASVSAIAESSRAAVEQMRQANRDALGFGKDALGFGRDAFGFGVQALSMAERSTREAMSWANSVTRSDDHQMTETIITYGALAAVAVAVMLMFTKGRR